MGYITTKNQVMPDGHKIRWNKAQVKCVCGWTRAYTYELAYDKNIEPIQVPDKYEANFGIAGVQEHLTQHRENNS